MGDSKQNIVNNKIEILVNYLELSKGLEILPSEVGTLRVMQKIDKRTLDLRLETISEILNRSDSEGHGFLQINFIDSTKILITDALIGFKPTEVTGLDMSRLPKVVTTPDLKSVFEALEEQIGSDAISQQEIEILKKVYSSILNGAEKVGFDLNIEKKWIQRLIASSVLAYA